jgi:putative ABC transport system permease protein
MRSLDLFRLALGSLSKQKLRSTLTVLGVVIGTATLTVSLAIGLGVRDVLEEQFRKEERLREISVFPNYDAPPNDTSDLPPEILTIEGEMTETKRERLKEASIKYWKRLSSRRVPKPITPERLQELAQLNHVRSVTPEIDGAGRSQFNGKSTEVIYTGITAEHRRVGELIEFGRGFSSDAANEIIVNEFLLYRWGIRDDAQIEAVLGQTVRLEIGNFRRSALSLLTMFGADGSNLADDELKILEKVWKELPSRLDQLDLTPREREKLRIALARKKPGEKNDPEVRLPTELKIVGVVRSPPKTDKRDQGFIDGPWRDAEVFLPIRFAEKWHLQLPQIQKEGFLRVRVVVDHESNLKPVVEQIRKMGFNEFSLGMFVEQIRSNARLIEFGMNFISLIALVVAAIGIANSLFTSVLERVKEIGIMKAVGATDRDVQLIFLIEGLLIGLIGGGLGLLVAWMISIPGDQTARTMMSDQPFMEGKTPESVFIFTPWMLVGVPLFATFITTLAAWLPARRAAQIQTVIALRHE